MMMMLLWGEREWFQFVYSFYCLTCDFVLKWFFELTDHSLIHSTSHHHLAILTRHTHTQLDTRSQKKYNKELCFKLSKVKADGPLLILFCWCVFLLNKKKFRHRTNALNMLGVSTLNNIDGIKTKKEKERGKFIFRIEIWIELNEKKRKWEKVSERSKIIIIIIVNKLIKPASACEARKSTEVNQ